MENASAIQLALEGGNRLVCYHKGGVFTAQIEYAPGETYSDSAEASTLEDALQALEKKLWE